YTSSYSLGCTRCFTLTSFTTLFRSVYGANDFYYAYCENTQGGLLRDAQIISELSPRSDNRPYSVVDAGWQWTGEAYGSPWIPNRDRKSTRLNSSHVKNSYAVFCLKK